MRAIIVVLAAASLLGGCVGISGLTAVGQYSRNEVRPFKNMTDTWRISDKPAEGRLMIEPSLGTVAGEALTDPFGFTKIPKSFYQTAVDGWLANTGRMCNVTDGYELISMHWEFKYSCP